MITYLQVLILGISQGITEVFPVSRLGHSALIAYLLKWDNVLKGTATKASNFLLFLIVILVATALALLFYYQKAWWRLFIAWLKSAINNKIENRDAKLAWLLIADTIPAGLIAFVLQTKPHSPLTKPPSAMIFVILNGILLLFGDQYIRSKNNKSKVRAAKEEVSSLALTFKQSVFIGIAQIFALIADVSRTGVTMIGEVFSGFTQGQTAKFSLLLATPIIPAARLYKLPSALSHKPIGMRGQMLVGGSLCASLATNFTVRFLDRYFKLFLFRPFGTYCITTGILMLLIGLGRGLF